MFAFLWPVDILKQVALMELKHSENEQILLCWNLYRMFLGQRFLFSEQQGQNRNLKTFQNVDSKIRTHTIITTRKCTVQRWFTFTTQPYFLHSIDECSNSMNFTSVLMKLGTQWSQCRVELTEFCLTKMKTIVRAITITNRIMMTTYRVCFTLRSFGAFCIEDAEVSEGFLFSIGHIDKILRVTNGKKQRILWIDLTATTHREILPYYSWLQPGSCKDDVLTAREYVYCSTVENKRLHFVWISHIHRQNGRQSS